MTSSPDSASTLPLQVKTCTKCGGTKPLGEFHKNSARRDGVCSNCKECAKARSSRWYADNPEKSKAQAKKQRLENPEKTKAYLAQWYLDNLDHVSVYRSNRPESARQANRDRTKEWASANPDKVRDRSAKRREDPKFRVENAMRISISSCIRRGTKKSPTFDTLGYTPDDLRAHLELGFTDGMNWSNYGRNGWHVDHIFPLASFVFETPDDPEFKRAFALTNLQPLWEADNCSKRDRLDHPSQAALLAA